MSDERARLAEALPGVEIGPELGRSTWSTVYSAVERGSGLPVVVRVLAPALTADPEARRRFSVQAKLLGALDHPHVVHTLDAVERDDLCAFVLEAVTGGMLRERMPSGGVRPDVACALAIATCSGLDHAWAHGMLHRNISPENLLFSSAGVLRVGGFGMVEVAGGGGALRTASGQLLAPAAYTAPEQVLGRGLTPAIDVYALGTVLYEMLTDQLPFPGENDDAAMLHRHVHEPPTPLADVDPQLPGPIAGVVMRALATDPAARPPDSEAFGIELADAAHTVWGPGWVSRSGIEVWAPGRLGEHLAGTAPRPSPAAPATPPTSPPARRLKRSTIALGAAAAAAVIVVLAVALTRGSGSSPGRTGGAATAAGATLSGAGVGGGPGPTATQTPAQITGHLVFADPMTDPKSGWAPDAGQDGNGTAGYQSDGYHVVLQRSLPPLNTFSVASPFTPRLTAMTVAVDAFIAVGAPADGAAVRCDQGGGRTGLRYTFEIHPDGTWVIFKIDGNGPKALNQGTSPVILRGHATNSIVGTCSEAVGGVTRLSLAVNGVAVGEVADTHAAGAISWHGALAIYRDAESPGTEVRFTNFRTFDASSP